MTEDLINKKDIYFPSYLGTNDNLITLLNRATQILCDWFSKADKYGPLPFDENFKCLMPDEEGNSSENKSSVELPSSSGIKHLKFSSRGNGPNFSALENQSQRI